MAGISLGLGPYRIGMHGIYWHVHGRPLNKNVTTSLVTKGGDKKRSGVLSEKKSGE